MKLRINKTSGTVLVFACVLIFSFFVGVIAAPNLTNRLLALILGININQISSLSTGNLKNLQPEMIRLDSFPWDMIEAKKGLFDFTTPDRAMRWARDGNFNVLGILQYAPAWANGQTFKTPRNLSISNCGIPDLEDTDTSYNRLRTYPPKSSSDFGNFAYRMAKRYPDVRYWQIWNEPNNPIFWPSGPNASQYSRMLKAAYGKIKKANPSAQVVLGGISLNDLDYINQLYKSGTKNYFDILAVHLYNPAQQPDDYLANELEKLHQAMVAGGDDDKPIWLTEIGWYTGAAKNSVTDRQQAEYLKQTYRIANSKPYVGAVFWNTLMDCDSGYDASNPEHNYGIFDGNSKPKQGVDVMRGIILNKKDLSW